MGALRYLSVCSGIEAATVAWHPLGWEAAAFSEIEAFPRAVLAHHYPNVPCHGDFTTIGADEYGPIDLLVGGTPCQSFSLAGLRKGLADDRGNLALEYLRLADRTRARWLVWENVPGVLSSNDGRDFGAFLGALGELGYGFAYRVLDAQYLGVAQQRRRVFVIGYLGDWRPPVSVLFERHSLSGHSAPSREARKGIAEGACRSVAASLTGSYGKQPDNSDTGLGPNLVAVSIGWQNSPSQGDGVLENRVATLDKSKTPAVAWTVSVQSGGFAWESEAYPTLSTVNGGNQQSGLRIGSAVRRLTPRECERLQGFPDDYTLVPYRKKPASDGPRYKALGNSMAVPVMRWIGRRIDLVDSAQVMCLAA